MTEFGGGVEGESVGVVIASKGSGRMRAGRRQVEESQGKRLRDQVYSMYVPVCILFFISCRRLLVWLAGFCYWRGSCREARTGEMKGAGCQVGREGKGREGKGREGV